MSKLSYSAQIVIIIFGSIGAVLVAYALWRLWAAKHPEPHINDMSPEQKEYMYSVRDRNRQMLMQEAGVRM